ncbi:tRNA 2-thiocytidine biosynthesis TtcA [Heracleum sosnowskyi]|uniref:tRNA 2-thiocytidine biosynthesis TtcA n=1 Tax=Heracleum sosnowskyi TaxID=360622 RepID=A0AAD8I2R0_9APIA|nr:tRNA 2-thiocytidine biosynthesis TtcA [Heracleum sosnowskyi]
MTSFCSSTTLISPPLLISKSSTPSKLSSSYSSPVLNFPARRPANFAGKVRVIVRRTAAMIRMGEEEKLTRRNPLDFPIEWERPKPGRRPDIFPQFSPMKTPLPPPMPYDPPEEDEEEEEKKEEEEDPEKEEGDNPESRWFPFRW